MTFMSCFMFRAHMVLLLALSSISYISAMLMAIHLPEPLDLLLLCQKGFISYLTTSLR